MDVDFFIEFMFGKVEKLVFRSLVFLVGVNVGW